MKSGDTRTDPITEVAVEPESDGVLAAILELSDAAVICANELHEIVYFNVGAERIFGFTKSEITGQPLGALLPEHARPIHGQHISNFASSATISRPMYERGPVTALRKSGEVFPAEASISKIQTEKGTLFTVFLRDITLRRETEQELARVTNLLGLFFDTAPAGMAVFDSELRYVRLNQTLAEINGLSVEDHLGKRPSDLLPGTLGLEVEQRFRTLLETGQPILNEEIRGETEKKPGASRNWLHSFFPIGDEHGAPNGIGAVIIEITALKSLEEHAHRSQKLEALGQMAGGIAHNLNNLLSPILGYASLLKEGANPDSHEYEYSRVIAESALLAKEMVGRILGSRTGYGSNRKSCDLGEVLQETLKLIRTTLPKTIHIVVDAAHGSSRVLANPGELHELIVNLSLNADDAMGGVGELEFLLEDVELDRLHCYEGKVLDGSHVRLAVHDNGAGMDEGTLARAFDPFFSTKDFGEGTGLGLTTVFGIVRDHDGGIRVDTTPIEGTTIEVFLPALDQQEYGLTGESDHTFGGKETILYVDDEQAIALLGKTTLERYGYRVESFTDALEAFDAFKTDPGRFDLVITDQSMPHMTGDELSKQMLAIRPDLPILLSSGDASGMNAERRAIGIRAFLSKPVEPKRLREVVRNILDRVI